MSRVATWSDKLHITLRWLFAGLFFLTPLVLWPKTSELFEFNKMLTVYAFTLAIAGVYLGKAILNKQLSLVRTPLDLALTLFLASQVASTVFSINVHTSLWGYYSRFHGGLMSTITYISLFYFLASFLNAEAKARRQASLSFFLYAILSSATLVALYGVLERLGIDKHLWIQDVQSRVFSTLGQPNWLSAYLAALLPLPIYLAVQTVDRRRKWLWAGIALLYFVTILFTRSRSGIATTFIILALIGAKEVFTVVRRHSFKKSPLLILLAFLGAILWFGSPWSPSPTEIKTRLDLGGPLWPELEPRLNRLGLSSQVKPVEKERLPEAERTNLEMVEQGQRVGGSSSMEIRQVVWDGAVALFRQRPLLGTGVETFGYSYYWTRPSRHNLLSEWDFLYNKAHNEYLNFLATSGLVGLGTYLFLTLSILWLFGRELRKKNPLAFPLLVGFISILITNFFGFSVVVIALFFFLFPVLLLFSSEEDLPVFTLGSGWNLSQKELKRGAQKLSAGQYTLLAIVALAVFWGLFQLYKFWKSDLLYTEGKLYQQAGYLGQAVTLLEAATKTYPEEPVFHAQLGETYADVALAVHQKLDAGEASSSATLFNQAVVQRDLYAAKATDEAQTALDQNPWHLNLWKTKAKIELTLALIDSQYYDQALATLARAIELAPTDAKIVYNMGLVYEQQGKLEQAKQAYEKALELKPDYFQVQQELDRLAASGS